MSSFFDSASLVQIPSGYSDGTLYSVKPIDGSGDLTFTRSNDTATRVGPDSLIEKVRTNLLLQSQDFATTWGTSAGITLTSGQTDPFGGTDAFLVNFGTSLGNSISQSLSLVSGVKYTLSAYIKGVDLTGLRMIVADNSSVSVMSQVVNGTWVRVVLTGTAATTGSLTNQIARSDNTLDQSFYIYGAQFETGDIATDYIATTTAAVSVGPVADLPRLDYTDSTCPKLLLEPQRTNLVTYSEQQDNSSWTKAGATITANATTSPDGYTNADKVVEDTSTATHGTYTSASISNATAYTWSGFFKAGERTKIRFLAQTGGTPYANFNLSNGTVESTSGSITASIVSFGNGWYRCIATSTSSATTAYFNWSMLDASGSESYTGNGTSGLYIWGCSIEEGAYETSYIPTIAATTRGAESAYKTGISSLIGQTEGVLFIDFVASAQNADGVGYSAITIFGDANDNFQIYTIGTALYWYAGGSSGVLLDESANQTLVAGQRYKIAYAYKSGDWALYINGVQKRTNTAAAVPAVSQFNLNATTYGAAVATVKNEFSQALLFPTRLSNADLAALTA